MLLRSVQRQGLTGAYHVELQTIPPVFPHRLVVMRGLSEGDGRVCFWGRPVSAWISFDYYDDTCICGDRPGVYAIYLDGKLVYIGSGVSVCKRLSSHLKIMYSSFVYTPWGRSKNVTVKFSPSRKRGDWTMREIRLIGRLKPVGNKTHKGVCA